jgi:hypothetical protein
VGNGYDLSTTSVGIQLTTDIKAMILRDTSRITELEEELRRTAADNAAMRARLEGDLNDLIGKLKRAEDDIERLKQRRVSFARICLSTYCCSPEMCGLVNHDRSIMGETEQCWQETMRRYTRL